MVRGLVIVLAVVAIGTAYATSRDGGAGGAPASAEGASAPANAVRIRYAYSSNLEDLMASLLARFNAAGVEVRGRPIHVTGVPEESGEMQAAILAGKERPHVWTPASSLWGRLLNYEADRAYARDDNPSLVASPIVVAMWEPLARALGWPGKAIGFRDILTLATTRSSWAAYGKPTYGDFKLGHTNPDFSTSGLSFVAAQYFTAAGKREGLTIDDVRRPEIRAKVRAIERSIVHYGHSGSFFADRLAEHGPAFASAVAMEETTLVEFNAARRPGELRLVAIYPADGTFMADNPYIVLDAPWVDAPEREAAEALGRWLRAQLTPEIAARFHYRPGDPDVEPLPPITRANGVDPAQPQRVLSLPEPRVLAAIKDAWRADRKPANVLLVVDVSGSMDDDDKLEEARDGLKAFLRQLSPHDRVGLLSFAHEPTLLQPVTKGPRGRARLRALVDELVANGDTALHDATLEAWRVVDQLGDDSRINAVVVLSDGEDTASEADLDEVIRTLRSRAEGEGRSIRMFGIAYGKDAQVDVLERIAHASGGRAYDGDPETIQDVYHQISSYF